MGKNDVEHTDTDIAYQNKDIFSKFMGERNAEQVVQGVWLESARNRPC